MILKHYFPVRRAERRARPNSIFKPGGNNAIAVYISLRQMRSVEPPALCMVITDLTERKKRDELIASGKLSNSILESAAEAIAVCDDSRNDHPYQPGDGRSLRLSSAISVLQRGIAAGTGARDLAGPGELFSIYRRTGGTKLCRPRKHVYGAGMARFVSLLLSAGPDQELPLASPVAYSR